MLQVAVLGSGRGSNFQAILDAVQRGDVPDTTIRVVLSNNSTSGILEIARAHRIPAVHLSRKMFETDEAFDEAMLDLFGRHGVSFIVLAGYMKRVSPRVIAAFRNRIVNIHPALLPAYGGRGMYGMHVHEAVIAAQDRVSGATVHLVDEEFDRGPIVLQESVGVEPADTPAMLAERVLGVEHRLYPRALQLFAEGRIVIADRTVIIH
jgi:phosphoribosylglycinamide formyltransferase 1